MNLKKCLPAGLIAGILALPIPAITCCYDNVDANVVAFGNCVRDMDECEDSGGHCGDKRKNSCAAEPDCPDTCLTYPIYIAVLRVSPCVWDEVDMACECAGNYTVTWALQVGCSFM